MKGVIEDVAGAETIAGQALNAVEAVVKTDTWASAAAADAMAEIDMPATTEIRGVESTTEETETTGERGTTGEIETGTAVTETATTPVPVDEVTLLLIPPPS